MAWPPPTEVAELTIGGRTYTDWETVLVKHCLSEQPPYLFRFTCSEGMPLAKNVFMLQIKPGDYCTIKLAGILAFSGQVHTRQVFYDAFRHNIEIQGASTLETSVASVILPSQELLDKTLEESIKAVLDPLKIKLVVEGGQLPTEKIEKTSIPPGQSTYSFIDNILRSAKAMKNRHFDLTSDAQGNFVIIVDKVGGSDEVIEGINILEARSIIFNLANSSGLSSVGMRPGNDQKHATEVTSQPYSKSPMEAALGLTLPNLIVNEGPAWSVQNLQNRLSAESRFQLDDAITVNATVYGWLRPSGGLWVRGQNVLVTSPMLIMEKQPELILNSVTFTQDNTNGTRSILELKNSMAIGQSNPSV